MKFSQYFVAVNAEDSNLVGSNTLFHVDSVSEIIFDKISSLLFTTILFISCTEVPIDD